ncbi:MAG: ABC transporter substrate-binding protein [Cytophagales bacterium]|nr:ABC transporter substrate-binding protein [Cytophagales bacterium]
MRILTFLFLFISVLSVRAQSIQQMYLGAKSLYNEGHYPESINLFSNLANDPMFGAYATFYLGLSYHKNGENQKGLDIWKQLLIKYPNFSQSEEVHFWRSQVLFVRGDYDRAVKHAQELSEDATRKSLYRQWMGSLPFQLIQQLQIEYKEDNELARLTVGRSLTTDLSPAEEEYIDKLKDKFRIASGTFVQDDVRKSAYSVAVFLPFLFDDLSNTDQAMKNTLVMDLYQGMVMASSKLKESGIRLELSPYDTKRDVLQTEALLQNEELRKVDLIIGPLLPEPISLVNDFSKTHEINMINPVSSNSRTVENNPFAFQMKPSYKTMARRAAEFVAANATKTESMIYYEDKRAEKTMANEFERAIKELGFVVTNFQPIDSKSAREVLARFSDQEESVLNITDKEAVRLLENGRLIRERQKFDASGNLITKADGTPKLEYYELNFTFDTDSLDHIFAATRSNLLANNFVGAIESIPDTVRLIGLGDWLDFSMLDYRQLERLKVNLISSQYFDRTSDFFKEVKQMCIREYRTVPSIYHMLGFESVWWSGQMMNRYGKYFQNGFYKEQDFLTLFYGHKYREGTNDNQIVPIVQFVNRELKVLNLSDETGKE